MDLKITIFSLKNIDSGAKFGKNDKYGPKNRPFRIIKMGHVSEVSAAHGYQTFREFIPLGLYTGISITLSVKTGDDFIQFSIRIDIYAIHRLNKSY